MSDEARSIADLGAAIYGADPQVPPALTSDPLARNFEQLASALHDKPKPASEELPAEVAALRDADPARSVYDDRTQYQAARIDKALTELGFEGVAAEVEHKAWAGVFVDAGLTSQDATDMMKLAVMDEAPAEEAATWPERAKASLQETYGAEDWQAALADARLLVKRDPRVKDFLNRTGLGDHPHVVKLAAQRARALIANGTLKRD